MALMSLHASITLAQSGTRGIPSTRMVPISPPFPQQSGAGPSDVGQPSFSTPRFGLPAGPPTSRFDPYATNPQPNSFSSRGLGSNGMGTAPGFGGASRFGGAPGALGPNVTPIGPPTPVPGPNSPSIAGPSSAPGFGNAPGFGGGSGFGSSSGGGLLGGLFSRPASAPIFNGPVLNAPAYPGGYDNPNVYGTPSMQGPHGGGLSGIPSNPFPGSAFPSSSPSTLFPGGLSSGGLFSGGGILGGDAYGATSAYRLFQGPRIRHSYIGAGDQSDDVNINDTDVSAIFAFQNFLYSSQPLYVVPSFSLHLWDGPSLPGAVGAGGADLPGSAYSGFIDFGWNSDPSQMFSTEFGVRVGAFTDFSTFNSDSIRVLGKGLASFRLTPASTLKAGVYYLDRNKVKLLPAGGLLYQPNPYTRMDIFFPEPKLARYWRTVGTRDVWWYLAGDYGGGSWTIQRDNGTSDSIDINDIRVMFGVEWGDSDAIRAGRRQGFFEVGYVFDREVEYRRNPLDDFKPDDGIMFRLGIGY